MLPPCTLTYDFTTNIHYRQRHASSVLLTAVGSRLRHGEKRKEQDRRIQIFDIKTREKLWAWRIKTQTGGSPLFVRCYRPRRTLSSGVRFVGYSSMSQTTFAHGTQLMDHSQTMWVRLKYLTKAATESILPDSSIEYGNGKDERQHMDNEWK
jgi:hypothetical protein